MVKKSTTIRLESAVHKAAIRRYHQLGFKTYNDYLDALIRIDLEQTPAIHTVRTENGPHYFTSESDSKKTPPTIKK